MAVSKVKQGVSDKVDNRYYVQLYNPVDGNRYKKVVHGKKEALAHEAEMKGKLAGRVVGSSADRQKTVGQLFEEYLDSTVNLAPSTARDFQDQLRRHVLPVWGDVRVSQVTSAMAITKWLDQVEIASGPGVRMNLETRFRGMLKIAVREGLLMKNPLEGVKRRQYTPKQVYVPTVVDLLQVREEWATPSRNCKPNVCTMYVAMLEALTGTGLRAGELLGLSTDDIDKEAGTVTVRRQLMRDRYRSPKLAESDWMYFAPPKTDDSARTVPVPQFVIAALSATLLHSGAQPVTLPFLQRHGDLDKPLAPQTHDLVFWNTATGGAFVYQALASRLRTTGRKLALGGPGQTLHAHAIRHRYTTELAMRSVPTRVIDYVTGHKPSGSVSYSVYTHVTEEGLDLARKATAAVWAEALQQQAEKTPQVGLRAV